MLCDLMVYSFTYVKCLGKSGRYLMCGGRKLKKTDHKDGKWQTACMAKGQMCPDSKI